MGRSAIDTFSPSRNTGIGFQNTIADARVTYALAPGPHLAPDSVDTGDLAANHENRFGLEVAWLQGPLSLQGEYATSDLDSPPPNDPSFAAHYVEASYFLTGERRKDEADGGVFDRVSPLANFGREGCGAWQLASRYGNIELDNGAITAGEAGVITAGVDWYLNPNTRVMFDNADTENVSKGP